MFGTIENTHNKVVEKISLTKRALDNLNGIILELNDYNGKKKKEIMHIMENVHINLLIDSMHAIETNYNLSIVQILASYYDNIDEERYTRDYYRIINSENFIAKINDFICQTENIIGVLGRVKEMQPRLDDISKTLSHVNAIEINCMMEKRNYEICKCGSRMTVVPELSELRCPECQRIKTIVGAVFRDDQFYPQEGQKTKHGGYDTSRHYRFWIERIQALETKSFDDADLAKIEYVLKRDQYDRRTLTCEQMREILKDPKVACTHLNDHASLLVKTFGGPPPPQLDFQENKLTSIRFNKTMRLYDIINPAGGNKPYYPYFIYKILEDMFKNNPEKLRILEYIHLQSRETVIKNDKYYEQICTLADPQDGLVYCATDPAGRFK